MSAIADVSGLVAVVTGGASGIGKGIAQRLVERGAHVVIADIEQDPLSAAATEIGALGVRTDVSDAASVQALADQVVDRFGKVHLVFNNAGVGPESSIADMTLPDWNWILDVNLLGVIHGVHAFLPLLKKHGEPAYIVNTSSMGGFVADMPGLGAYATTKFAITALTEALASELERESSTVGAAVLAPGTVRSNIANSLRTRPAEAKSGGFVQNDISRNEELAKLRWLDPTDVGDIVLAALARGETHIVTHPEWYPMVAERTAAIEAAFNRAAAATASDPKDVIRAFVDALNRRDWERVGRLITPDFSYTIQSYHLPGAATPMDGETMLKVLPQMLALFDETGPQLEISRLVAEGTWVVAEAQGSGYFRDGSPYANRYANVYEVVDGRVRTLREYLDTQHTAQSFAAVTGQE